MPAADADGQPWFATADVCAALGISKTTMALARLDDDEKGSSNVGIPGGLQKTIVNELGAHTMVMGSRKTGAKRSNRSVTDDVLQGSRDSWRHLCIVWCPTQTISLVKPYRFGKECAKRFIVGATVIPTPVNLSRS